MLNLPFHYTSPENPSTNMGPLPDINKTTSAEGEAGVCVLSSAGTAHASAFLHEVFCTLSVLLVCEVTCGRMKGLQAAGCLVAGRWFVQVAKAGFISLLPKPFSTYLC